MRILLISFRANLYAHTVNYFSAQLITCSVALILSLLI